MVDQAEIAALHATMHKVLKDLDRVGAALAAVRLAEAIEALSEQFDYRPVSPDRMSLG